MSYLTNFMKIIIKTLNIILGDRRPKGRFNFRIGHPQCKENKSMELTITNTQKVTIDINPVTDETPPRPAPLEEGKTTLEVQGDGTSTGTVSDDGKSITLVSSDEPSITQFLLSGDADIGDGVETIQELIILNVVGAKAKSFGLSARAPEAK